MSTRALGDRIGIGLQQFYQYANSQIATVVDADGTRTSGFVLDIPRSRKVASLGIGATALGLSVYALSPSPDHDRMEEMARYIASVQAADGSWSISVLRHFGVPLVYTTCYALQGLARYGASNYRPQLQLGLDWLLGAAGTDGGWSLTGTGGSHVHATAEAVFTLFLIGSGVPREIVSRGQHWLLEHRVGPYWCDENGTPSVYFTALAYRALIPNGTLRFQLSSSREWLIRRLQDTPCREEISYHIPITGKFLRETISCFTRAIAFEALTTDPFLGDDPRFDAEARRLLRNQDRLGAWACPGSDEVPMFLNCAAFVALRNHRDSIHQRPRWPLRHDLTAAFQRRPGLSLAVSILALVGLAGILRNVASLSGWIASTAKRANDTLTGLSGIANLFQILGVGVLGISVVIIRWAMKRRGMR